MPLIQGSSRQTISKNIAEFHHGKTFAHTKAKFGPGVANRQAIAVALSTARKARRKQAGGGLLHLLHMRKLGLATPQLGRGRGRVGPVAAATPGRLDNQRLRVPGGSYVLPADHISAMGQGNTAAGLKAANQLFGRSATARVPSRASIPGLPRASGGTTPVIAAGGEYVISPEAAMAWHRRQGGRGNLAEAHDALDRWVMATRRQHIKQLAQLPPPAKD